MFTLLLVLSFMDLQSVDVGFASVYYDKTFACPKTSYIHTGLPVCANRELPCGTILNVKRIDTKQVAKCVVGDRGPYGVCVPSKKNTRACGHGSKWINGRNFIKKKKPMNTAVWRGILDMTRPLARLLGVKNRLVPVVIYTDFANNAPFSIIPDDEDDPKLDRISNNLDTLTFLENAKSYDETRTASGEINNR